MVDIVGFLKNNHEKKMTFLVWIYAARFRMLIKWIPAKKLEKYWGIRGEESTSEIAPEHLEYARIVAAHVRRSCKNTPWESKCLVQALTARKLLLKKKIPNTLYLGVGKDENMKMIAHAWIRTGSYYVTGGNGKNYAIVAKFRS